MRSRPYFRPMLDLAAEMATSTGESKHFPFFSTDTTTANGNPWRKYSPVITTARLNCRFHKRNSKPWNRYFKADAYLGKIVATTDRELWDLKQRNLDWFDIVCAMIDKPFIEVLIKAYNEGKPITEVLLEQVDNGGEEWMGDDYTGQPFWNSKLELKLKSNGSVIVHPVKERMYTGAEVMQILDMYAEECFRKLGNTLLETTQWFDTTIQNKTSNQQSCIQQ